jgi:hypothetical protein
MLWQLYLLERPGGWFGFRADLENRKNFALKGI